MNELPVYHKNGVALEGYDPVSYFKDHGPSKGLDEYCIEYEGLLWRFKNAENLALFQKGPTKYVPQYGGYCAFGLSNGYKAKPKMDAFCIREAKLYLNFAQYVQERWLEDVEEKIKKADQKWPATKSSIPISANRHWIFLKYRILKIFGRDIFK